MRAEGATLDHMTGFRERTTKYQRDWVTCLKLDKADKRQNLSWTWQWYCGDNVITGPSTAGSLCHTTLRFSLLRRLSLLEWEPQLLRKKSGLWWAEDTGWIKAPLRVVGCKRKGNHSRSSTEVWSEIWFQKGCEPVSKDSGKVTARCHHINSLV